MPSSIDARSRWADTFRTQPQFNGRQRTCLIWSNNGIARARTKSGESTEPTMQPKTPVFSCSSGNEEYMDICITCITIIGIFQLWGLLLLEIGGMLIFNTAVLVCGRNQLVAWRLQLTNAIRRGIPAVIQHLHLGYRNLALPGKQLDVRHDLYSWAEVKGSDRRNPSVSNSRSPRDFGAATSTYLAGYNFVVARTG